MKLPDYITRIPSRKKAESEELPVSGGKFVNLLNDKNFKMIFTKEKNKQVLIDMLNRFIPDIQINDLSFMPQQQNPEQKELVSSAFDVSCETDSGRHIIVEVQYNERKDFLDRVLYYSTWPVSEQIKAGHKTYTLNDVYIVSFLNFALVHDSSWEEKTVSSYCIREDTNGEKMTDALHFIFIELGRFKKSIEDSMDDRDWWMYSLKNIGKMDTLPTTDIPLEIKRLYDVTEVESLDEHEMTKYLQNMRTEFDIRTEKIMAREEGLEEGREEGRKEGREKEQRRIASALKAMGMAIDDISKATGLNAEAIAGL